MQVSLPETSAHRRFVTPDTIARAAFLPTGVITVLLGPLLPTLAVRWSLNDTQAGYLVTAQFLGALLSTLSSGVLLPRLGYRRTIASGLFLMALGTPTLISGPFALGLLAVFGCGMGIGLTIPAGNLLVAEARPEWRSSALNLLNFSWSAGAVACPFLLAMSQRGRGIHFFLGSIAGLLGLLIVVVLVFPCHVPRLNQKEPSAAEQSWLPYLRNSSAMVLGALFFGLLRGICG